MASAAMLEAHLAPLVAADQDYLHANAHQLTELSIENLVRHSTNFLPSSGLVFAGYGADEIFPSYFQTKMCGHVGSKFVWGKEREYVITHENDAWIQPFAQSSMIDRFTDGFDSDEYSMVSEESLAAMNAVVTDLTAAGVVMDNAVFDPIVTKQHAEFLKTWQQRNLEANFYPLRRVLNSLSVPEMGHLAESLLVLEALRERVTSPSESVGGR